MNTADKLHYLFSDKRALVYLVWAVLLPVGFTVTQYHQQPNINLLWLLISVIGLGFMAVVMPLKLQAMRRIFLAWLLPITIGLIVSFLVFHITGWSSLIDYLGSYWLLVMAVGFFLTGLVDPPSTWYWVAVGLNLPAALLTYKVTTLALHQYLVAAAIAGVSMLGLWLFRSFQM